MLKKSLYPGRRGKRKRTKKKKKKKHVNSVKSLVSLRPLYMKSLKLLRSLTDRTLFNLHPTTHPLPSLALLLIIQMIFQWNIWQVFTRRKTNTHTRERKRRSNNNMVGF